MIKLPVKVLKHENRYLIVDSEGRFWAETHIEERAEEIVRLFNSIPAVEKMRVSAELLLSRMDSEFSRFPIKEKEKRKRHMDRMTRSIAEYNELNKKDEA